MSVRIADICSIKSGKRLPKGADFADEVTPYPYIRARDIKNGRINISDLVYLPEEVQKRIKQYIVETNDVVITIVGASVGDVALVEEKCNGFNLTENAVRLTNFIKTVNPIYVSYLLNSKKYWELMQQIAGGSAQPKLGIYKIESIEIDLLTIEVQNKIVSILSAYDDLIENNQKQIKLLEEAAQRLYKEWFVDLRFPGHENTSIVDGLPQGWRKSVFSDVFTFVRGKSYTSKELSDDSGVLMVNLKNIRAYGGYKRNAEKRFTGAYKEEQLLVDGDVVMGITDMTQERRLVGHVALIPSFNEKATFSMDLIKLIPSSVCKNYLYCALQYGGYSEQIAPLANGVNVLHLKPEAMMKMEMLVPDEVTMQTFDVQFEAMRLKIEALEKQCNLAVQARDRLLPKLMSGELEV